LIAFAGWQPGGARLERAYSPETRSGYDSGVRPGLVIPFDTEGLRGHTRRSVVVTDASTAESAIGALALCRAHSAGRE
jgi:hypothetical protein